MPENTNKTGAKPLVPEPSDFETRMLAAMRRMATDKTFMAEVAKKTS